jgi:hypothetical protein
VKSERIGVGRKSRVEGPLVGGQVTIQRDGRAEDVFGDRVELERGAEVRRIVANDVRLGRGTAAVEVLYTRTFEADSSASVRTPAQKVASLPPFPL